MKKYLYVAIGIALTFSSSTFAASTDFIDNTSYTSDALSGLDWLDLTTSVGQSYNYVSSQFGIGGAYEGWRYATGVEFNEMVSDYTDMYVAPTNYSIVNQEIDLIDGLVLLLSSTLDAYWLATFSQTWDSYKGYSEGDGLDYTNGILADSLTGHHFVASIFDNDGHDLSYLGNDYSRTHSGTLPNWTGRNVIGSYLVRDTLVATPIPATAFLFTPALVGLLGLRRKLK
ncbi:MAG: hypothetical protein ACKE8G_07720 [Methylophagaceae bacterium]